MNANTPIPIITADERSPLVIQLSNIIESQTSIIRAQSEEIQQLKDEIARLKKSPPRPKIRPSSLEKKKTRKSKSRIKKRPGSEKRSKTIQLEIHETKPIEPEYIPEGAEFRCYKDFVVQDITIKPCNTRFRLKVYATVDGRFVSGKLPAYLNGKHFGPELIRLILYQYYHCRVTQPILLEQLIEMGIDISAGQLNNILIEEKNLFHQEKDDILAAGLQVSSHINVDDTGARHKGKNGYCTHIGNESFSWFESTASKSRINFLKLLRPSHDDYCINTDAVTYMIINKLPEKMLDIMIANHNMFFANESEFNGFLAAHSIVTPRHIRIVTEGALIGAIVEHGISKDLVIVSDDAGQFNVLLHALCWIHANRTIEKVVPVTASAEKDLNSVKDRIWKLYQGLKAYKKNPTDRAKKRLELTFEKIFTTRTCSQTLNLALGRIYKNKSELLLVLERPDIPLHNNLSENAIREYVQIRKISGSTRSDIGRKCRDTFMSLKKTCRKLGVSFWQYLLDRIEKTGRVARLSDLIREQALKPG